MSATRDEDVAEVGSRDMATISDLSDSELYERWEFERVQDDRPVNEVLVASLEREARGRGFEMKDVVYSLGITAARIFDPDLHPRGRDGKFIEKLGLVELFDVDFFTPAGRHVTLNHRRGQVVNITPDPKAPGNPTIKVRVDDPATGKPAMFVDVKPNNISAAPKAKAHIGKMARPTPTGDLRSGDFNVGDETTVHYRPDAIDGNPDLRVRVVKKDADSVDLEALDSGATPDDPTNPDATQKGDIWTLFDSEMDQGVAQLDPPATASLSENDQLNAQEYPVGTDMRHKSYGDVTVTGHQTTGLGPAVVVKDSKGHEHNVYPADLTPTGDHPISRSSNYYAGEGDTTPYAGLTALPKPEAPSGAGTKADPIKTSDVDVAAQALGEGKYVELDQPSTVSVFLDRLGEIASEAKAKGEDAPTYDLCRVSVPGTNLFCAETKNIPRIRMPQLKTDKPEPGTLAATLPLDERGEADGAAAFIDYLRSRGIDVTSDTVNADTLRPSQNELNGAKVAGIMGFIEGGGVLDGDIFITSDDYVVDGHHRWAAQVGAGIIDENNLPINVQRIDAPILKVLAIANNWTTANGFPHASVADGPLTDDTDASNLLDRLNTPDVHGPDTTNENFVQALTELRQRVADSGNADGVAAVDRVIDFQAGFDIPPVSLDHMRVVAGQPDFANPDSKYYNPRTPGHLADLDFVERLASDPNAKLESTSLSPENDFVPGTQRLDLQSNMRQTMDSWEQLVTEPVDSGAPLFEGTDAGDKVDRAFEDLDASIVGGRRSEMISAYGNLADALDNAAEVADSEDQADVHDSVSQLAQQMRDESTGLKRDAGGVVGLTARPTDNTLAEKFVNETAHLSPEETMAASRGMKFAQQLVDNNDGSLTNLDVVQLSDNFAINNEGLTGPNHDAANLGAKIIADYYFPPEAPETPGAAPQISRSDAAAKMFGVDSPQHRAALEREKETGVVTSQVFTETAAKMDAAGASIKGDQVVGAPGDFQGSAVKLLDGSDSPTGTLITSVKDGKMGKVVGYDKNDAYVKVQFDGDPKTYTRSKRTLKAQQTVGDAVAQATAPKPLPGRDGTPEPGPFAKRSDAFLRDERTRLNNLATQRGLSVREGKQLEAIDNELKTRGVAAPPAAPKPDTPSTPISQSNDVDRLISVWRGGSDPLTQKTSGSSASDNAYKRLSDLGMLTAPDPSAGGRQELTPEALARQKADKAARAAKAPSKPKSWNDPDIQKKVQQTQQTFNEEGVGYSVADLLDTRRDQVGDEIAYARENGDNSITLKPPSGVEQQIPLDVAEAWAAANGVKVPATAPLA